MIWTEVIGTTTGVTADADTAMSDWVPVKSGTLRAIKIIAGSIAATTLVEHGYIKLTCAKFGGVDVYAPFSGSGLRTAPAMHQPIQTTEVNVPVVAGVPVKVFYYHNVTPTTPEIKVFGVIEG